MGSSTATEDLILRAREATRLARPVAILKELAWTGYVGAALESDHGDVFTGVNLSLYCAIGFCAEHSAVSEAVKHGQTRVSRIVAVTADGTILPPCGRCREMLFQIDPGNAATVVILAIDRTRPLSELIPEHWLAPFNQSLK